MLKSWARTQGSVALSSGEAEYDAAVKGGAEVLGVQSLLKDLGVEVLVRLWQDSTAAKGVASRVGVGKIKHMDVRHCWLQDVVQKRGLVCKKIGGKVNPADALTKPTSAMIARNLLEGVGYHIKMRNRG